MWIPLNDYRLLPAVSGIYVIRHRESGKEYVGQSKNVRKRAYSHGLARDAGTYLHRAVLKHGVGAFDIRVHAVILDAVERTAREIALIAQLETFGKRGFNRTIGGEGAVGRIFTDEQRRANGDRKRGHKKSDETKEKVRLSCLLSAAHRRGVPRSEETKAKIREARTRIIMPKRGPMSEAYKDAIRQSRIGQLKGGDNPKALRVGVWLPESFTPLVFSNGREAAKFLGVSAYSITKYGRLGGPVKTGVIIAYLD